MNYLIVSGWVFKEPQVRRGVSKKTGKPYMFTTFTLSTPAPTKLYVDVSVGGGMAPIAEKLKVRQAVRIEGSLVQNKWVDKTTGKNRYKLTVRADWIEVGEMYAELPATTIENAEAVVTSESEEWEG